MVVTLFTSSVLSGVSAYEGKLPLGKTISYWVIVWIFNFVGGALIAYMYYYSGLPLKYDGYILQHFVPAAIGKITAPFHELFLRGIFCNVFVCMSIWTATSESNLSGKILCHYVDDRRIRCLLNGALALQICSSSLKLSSLKLTI